MKKMLLPALLSLVLAAGCTTTAPTAKNTYYFFPPPPDESHLQYLTGFQSELGFRGTEDKTFLNYLTGTKPLRRELSKPYGVAVHGNNYYICDTEFGAIIVLDVHTRKMRLFRAEGEGALKLPLNLTLDADGTAYVADSQRDQVVIFDKDENYVATIGKSGDMKPRDVAVGKDKIYIADLQKHCVRVFDKASRSELESLPKGDDAKNAKAEILTPTNLALDREGNLYVGDTGGFHVLVFDATGRYVRTIGEFGDGPSQFARVKGVAVDHDKRLYAVDAMSQVTQIFDASGRLLSWVADPTATKATQSLPAKVMVDYDNVNAFKEYISPEFRAEYLVVIINQTGPHKVSVYAFGQKQ
ncbi:MAG TPA: 6-bladed beta-propeller [Verrucomicrobiae bacterium]